MIAKLLAAAALVAVAVMIEAQAAGDCIWGSLTVGSHHFDTDKDHNQKNWGPGTEVCLGRDDVRLVAGWYRNSERTDSLTIGGVAFPLQAGSWRFGLAVVRVSGYPTGQITEEKRPDGTRVRTGTVDDEPKLGGFFVAAYERERFGVNLLYIPKRGDDSAVMAWQLKWKFR